MCRNIEQDNNYGLLFLLFNNLSTKSIFTSKNIVAMQRFAIPGLDTNFSTY